MNVTHKGTYQILGSSVAEKKVSIDNSLNNTSFGGNLKRCTKTVSAGSSGMSVIQQANASVFLGYKSGSESVDNEGCVVVGASSGMKMHQNSQCTLIGESSGYNMGQCAYMTCVGALSGRDVQNGYKMTAIGAYACQSSPLSASSLAAGSCAGKECCMNTSVVLGVEACEVAAADTVVVSNAVIIGHQSSQYPHFHDNSVVCGYQSARYATQVLDSTVIGYRAAAQCASLVNTVVLGQNCLEYGSDVSEGTIAVGSLAGQYANFSNGGYSLLIGHQAAQHASSNLDSAVIVGAHAANSVNRVTSSILIGSNTISSNIMVDTSVCIGSQIVSSSSTLSNVIAVGSHVSLANNTSDLSFVTPYMSVDLTNGTVSFPHSNAFILGNTSSIHLDELGSYNWHNLRIDGSSKFRGCLLSLQPEDAYKVSGQVPRAQYEASKDKVGIQINSTLSTQAFTPLVNIVPAPGTSSTGYASIGTTSSSTTLFSTASSRTIKTDIRDICGFDAVQRILALKPCTFNWKCSGENGTGFLAHQVHEAGFPGAVTGDSTKEIDVSHLIPAMVKALQHAYSHLGNQLATHFP